MISARGMTVESAWQKRFGFGLATVNVVAYSYDGVFIIKDPIGVHFVKRTEDHRIAVLGFNVGKKTLRRFLDRFEGDHWVIRRPQDLGIVKG